MRPLSTKRATVKQWYDKSLHLRFGTPVPASEERVFARAERRAENRAVLKRMLPGRGLASRPGNGGGEHQYVKLRF